MPFVRVAVLVLACSVVAYAQVRTMPQGVHPQQLKTLSLSELGQIEVTTQSKEPTEVWDTAAPIYVLTGEDIRRSGVTNIPDALRLIPGVNVARVNGSRNWAVGIRGFGDQFSKYVLVLIDGRSIYTPLFGGVLWTVDNVMMEDIDRIEVIRGPGGSIWGTNAVNGIINIITKSAADTHGTVVSAGGGSVDHGTAAIRHGAHRGAWDYRGNAFGFARGPEDHTNNQRAYDWSRFGQAGFRMDRKQGAGELTILGDAYWGKFGDAQIVSTFTPQNTVTSYQSMNAAGGDILGRWRKDLGGRADIYLQGWWWHEHRIGSNFGEDRDTFDVDFLNRLRLGNRQQISWGAGARLSPSRISETVPTDTFVPAKKTDNILSAFLQDEIQIVPRKLVYTIGSKFERDTYTGFQFQPSSRLLYTPTQHLSLWASVSRAVRTPDRVDEDIDVSVFVTSPPPLWGRVMGNHALKAERLRAYELGGRTLIHSRLYVDVAGFHNSYHDLMAQSAPMISVNPGAPYGPGTVLVDFQFVNGIHGTTDGAEISPDWQATNWWRIRSGYSYLHIDLSDQPGFADTATLNSLHGSSPNSQAFLQSQIDISKKVQFDQVVRYVGALHAQQVPAYVTGDARFGWMPSKHWRLSVTGQNLLQPRHAEFGINPPPTVLIKRGVYAKLVWTK
jgi:iron complex outermembrane recepter protein